MLIDKKENFLIQNLYKKLEKNKFFYDETLKRLYNRINIVKLMDVFTNESYREDINEFEFYWLVKNYNDLIQDSRIEDSAFNKKNNNRFEYDFTDTQVNEAELYFLNNKTKEHNTVVIKRMDEIEDDREFCTNKIMASELSELFNYVSWNPFSQREITVKNAGFGMVKIPTIYRKNVEEIKNKMRNGEFFSNMISLNILKTIDDTEQYSYNEEERELVFAKARGSVLDCIDGFHRLTAISELISEDASYGDKIHMQLKIWHLDIQEASAFVNQEASGTAIKVEKRNISSDDLYSTLVKELATEGNERKNALKNRLGEMSEVDRGIKPYSLDLFGISISDNITLENAAEQRRLKKILNLCWNEIIFNNIEEFNDVSKFRNISALVHNNIVAFFNYIIIDLFQKNMSTTEILDILDTIFLTIDFNLNEDWQNLKITSIRYDKNQRVKIYNYARNVLEEVL